MQTDRADRIRSKRARSLSSSSSSSSAAASSSHSRSPSHTPSPPPKYHRASPSPHATLSFICTLPPTCSQPSTSTSYGTLAELERHQEAFHRWVCRVPIRDREGGPSRARGSNGKGKDKEYGVVDSGVSVEDDANRLPEGFVSGYGTKAWKECGKVFPDERLLELHHTETHDPIARERQSRGDKIFGCFLPTSQCGKVCATPASRRNHLITKHKYPKEYFFAITNHGLNQIAREDGLATSLIRPRKQGPPKPRRTSSTGHPTVDEPPPPPESVNAVEDTSAPSTTSEPSHLTTSEGSSANAAPMPMPCPSVPDVDMDDLTTRMGGLESSLGFVPRGVRKKAGVKAATAEAAEAANGAGAAAATSPGVG